MTLMHIPLKICERRFWEQPIVDFINLFKPEKSVAYCTDCAAPLYNGAVAKLNGQKENVIKSISNELDIIPIVTAQSPPKWNFTVINIVSSQSVSGTGIFSEISSSWADFLGAQSNSLGNKLSAGESICRNKLRLAAAIMGGNCVIATDIDYAEVGGAKAMLMVCMSGTAAILHNAEDVLEVDANRLIRLKEATTELRRLNSFKIPDL